MVALYAMVSLYMNNGDLLLSNLYCGQEEIGLYSVVITFAKLSVFLIATPLATMLLPKLAQNQGNPTGQRKLLAVSELITVGLSVLYGLVLWLVGGFLIWLLYGEAYVGVERYILPCAIFSVPLGAFWLYYQYAVAIDLVRIFAITTIVFGLAAVGYILLFMLSMVWIPLVMAFAMIATILVVAYLVRLRSSGGNSAQG